MKRDIKIMKEILVTIRDKPFTRGAQFEIPNIEYPILEGHLKYLINENYIRFESKKRLATGVTIFFDGSLSKKGYDYLESLEK